MYLPTVLRMYVLYYVGYLCGNTVTQDTRHSAEPKSVPERQVTSHRIPLRAASTDLLALVGEWRRFTEYVRSREYYLLLYGVGMYVHWSTILSSGAVMYVGIA